MIQAVTASTVHDDSTRAGKETADELLDQLGAAPDVVLLFVSANYAYDKVLEGLWRRLPSTVALIGCSTAGEINEEEPLDGSVTAMGLRLGGVAFEAFRLDPGETAGREAGRELGARLRRFDPELVILFANNMGSRPIDTLVQGLHQELDPALPIVGGGSGDDGSFKRTAQLYGRDVLDDGAVALALRGSLRVATAARTGWMSMGAPRTVTRVERGNLLLELDGAPALDIYVDYLGPRIADMPAASLEFPLGIVTDDRAGAVDSRRELLARTVIGVDEGRRALVLASSIDLGARVRVTRATKDHVVDAARAAMADALQEVPDPSFALFFNCIARKLVLGSRYKEDLFPAFSSLGPGVPRAGYYCYGELSRVNGKTAFCQQTFTAALVRG